MRDLRAAIRNQPPAEHEYDWAPLHMPGTVQSYGVLLVTDAKTRRVLFVSENAGEMLGIPPSDILDKSYLALTDSERERKLLGDSIGPETIMFPNPVRMTIKGREFDAVFHSQGGLHQIEIEPAQSDDAAYGEMSTRATQELFDPPSVEELYQRAVRVVREVSGFDRVMLYRFDPRYNGQVIAEATREGIGSFLGLYFPSSDIGARSRDLYLRNFTRYIPDIGAKSCGLTGVFPGNGRAESAHPVDMSNANLRSVVPCHITYLQNIGIKASMSFSINVDGRLWGLFACHHYAPRRVSYEQRVVCEQTAMMFIYRLVQMSSAAARLEQRQRGLAKLASNVTVGAGLRQRLASLEADWRGRPEEMTAQGMLTRAVAALQEEACFLVPGDTPPRPAEDAPLSESQRLLLSLVEADSAAIVRHGQVWRIGDAPPDMSVYAVASMFGRELPDLRGGDLHVYATDCLSAVVPVAEGIKDKAAGIMAAALSLDSPAYIIWFRREQIEHATWAGNPSADAMSAGAEGNNPRASFEAWKQDIRNLSRSWVLEDVQIGDELASIVRGLESGHDRAYSPAPHFHAPAPARMAPLMASPAGGAGIGQMAHAGPASQASPAAGAAAAQRRVIRIGQR